MLQKKLLKYISVFLTKKKKKGYNIVVNNTKMYQKMKNESLLSIEDKFYKVRQKSTVL